MAGHRLRQEVAVDSRAVQIVWALNDPSRPALSSPPDGPVVVLKAEPCADKAASRLGESVNVLHVETLEKAMKRASRPYQPTASFPDPDEDLDDVVV